MRFFLIIGLVVGLTSKSILAQDFETDDYTVSVTKLADELYAPWAVAIIDEDEFLVSERDGALLHFKNGLRQEVSGVPKVFANGQGGLLDVVLASDFKTSRSIFITYAKPDGRKAGTALGVGQLSRSGSQLKDFTVLFEQKEKTSSNRHFGSRVVEAPNGDLFVTTGDRGARISAQDIEGTNGKVLRVTRDGRYSIHSSGHRNPQGAALDRSGKLWTVEHGPKGGDEINRPEFGKNYGWPLISYGTHYTGGTVGLGTEKEGLEQPKHYWDPSIAPSGMMIYQGSMFPKWRGQIFIGSLKFDFITRLSKTAKKIREKEHMLRDQFGRIRDIREAPDGSIWFLSVGEGALYRIAAK